MSQPATETPTQRGKPQAKKVGGLPTYAWALIAVGGVLVWYIWRQNSQASAGNAQGTAANAFTQDLAANDALMLSESQYQNILAAIKNIQGPASDKDTDVDKDVDKKKKDKDESDKDTDKDKKKSGDDDDTKKKADAAGTVTTATAASPAATPVSPTVVNVVGGGSLPSMNGGGSLPAMGDGSTPIPAAANPKVAATMPPRKRTRR